MADYASNFTARYRVRYRAGGIVHAQMWRFRADTVASTMTSNVAAVGAYLQEIAPQLVADFQVLGAEFATGNSDVFLPHAAPTQPTGLSNGGQTGGTRANMISFAGRSITGAKARIVQYGIFWDQTNAQANDYRMLPGEFPFLVPTLDRIQTIPNLVGIDNEAVLWYRYANLSVNAYWQRKLRRS